MTDEGRRRFLVGTGLIAGLGAGCRSRPNPDPYAPDKPPVPLAPGSRPGAEKLVVSTCGMCDVGCGIRVRVVDGRVVKVEGNPESPVNGAGLCARGLAGPELLYHPHRVRSPMRRRGGRGGKDWQAISWDEAIAELGTKLGKLRGEVRPQALVLLDGQWRGNTHALWARFMAAFGSPNHIGHGATGRSAVAQTLHAMTGKIGLPSYDFQRAACVLLVGTGALEASSQAMPLARALSGGTRPRLLCVSSRLPRTAALVEEWFPVMPGRAAGFLLGILHVLMREQLADESAIAEASFSEEMRSLLMRAYSPKQVEGRTGIAAGRIESLTRELVAVRPAVVVVDEETKDRGAVAAALLLDAVLSSLDVPGGLLLPNQEPTGWPTPEMDKVATAGLAAPSLDGRVPKQHDFEASRILAVPDAIVSGKPYPAEVLLLHYSNPIFSKPEGRHWADAIAKVPFVVSFSPIADESVDFADMVLPDPTYFERWDVLPAGQGILSLQQPAVAPLAASMQTGEVILRLAAVLGGSVAKSFPWSCYRDAVAARLDGISPDGGKALLEEMTGNGIYKLAGRSQQDEVPAAGRGQTLRARNDRPSPGSLREPTSPPVAGRSVGSEAKPPSLILDLAPALAEPAPPSVAPGRLVLVPFRDRRYAEGGFRHLPWLAELSQLDGNPWTGFVEMAPEDARRLGIAAGDLVAVTSPVARLELRVRIHAGVMPGVLGLPIGGWGSAIGNLERMPSRLLAALVDAPTGLWLAWGTSAQVEKVG